MLYPAYDPGDLPEAQRQANLETVRRVREVVAELVRAERRRRHTEDLLSSWSLDRDELDRAATSLGMPPLRDEEWEALHGAG
ncbi:hypothetical protein [Sphaerisporangium sp. TRM90804]|uniref:hypothetical protein n=1 Tax=Sphaerisporangium sp. TRM90804 TaxID=3031113 RepID=UPI00244CC7FF|nr:hypothetical protein [Sphaerisporangium sp. TRM90804]MDH2430680.1 hypothetical protein [Sphaerisporangium sp. TRM90804]